jgi:hypothetical protein
MEIWQKFWVAGSWGRKNMACRDPQRRLVWLEYGEEGMSSMKGRGGS